ncbi:hypothetical protein SDC9_195429 [bioreactor metagenome]|uniref:Uncharacterized protein n=1 Tax=bioreactor metagenome TaxID=1076179 RepID=A0A645I905_9ZZZZ
MATIYLGCGSYYHFGSDLDIKFSHDINENGNIVTTTTERRLGYLSKEEFDFAYNEIITMREKRRQEILDLKLSYMEKARELLFLLDENMRINSKLVPEAQSIKVVCEDKRNKRVFGIIHNNHTGETIRSLKFFKDKLSGPISLREIRALYDDLNYKATQLKQDNEYFRNICESALIRPC